MDEKEVRKYLTERQTEAIRESISRASYLDINQIRKIVEEELLKR